MRIPLTRYGLPEVVVYPAGLIIVMVILALFGPAVLPTWAIALIETVLAIILAWALLFFRDPHRDVPQDDSLLLAPADGKVMDVETVENAEFMDGPALRVGIFLSLFNTHINRAPCNARVEKIAYRRGKYLAAMNPLAGKVNESNDIGLVRANRDRLLVRQVSGAVARRIVCAAREGQQLVGGEPFGMIKFGSRTELYLPSSGKIECLVRVGDRVKAGITPVARYSEQ